MRAREASDNVTDDERQLGIERGRKVRKQKNYCFVNFENNIEKKKKVGSNHC